MPKNNIKIMKKILATMSILAFGAGIVNISEAAIGRIPSISSRNHDTMQGRQGRNNDRFNNNDSRNNNRRNENQAPALKDDSNENINANAVNSPEPRVESNRGNNNSRVGNKRNENNSRRIETPAKIVRDIDRTHDATYDEDDRYRAERESYYENDGNGRIVDHQIETIDDRHRASATESDRERGRETIINRYEGEDKYGNKKNDERGITVVVNNNIPIENNVKVDVKTENINENDNDIKLENKNNITSTNTNNNDNKNENESKVEVPITQKIDPPKDETPKIPSNVKIPTEAYVYNGHSYYIYSGKVNTWEAARDYCSSLGGYLMIINDNAENNAVYDYMRNVGYSSAYFGLKKDNNGVWYWVDNQRLGYSNWAPDEPNNAYGVEKYGMFYWKYIYTWNDGDFNITTDNGGDAFICEWDYVLTR